MTRKSDTRWIFGRAARASRTALALALSLAVSVPPMYVASTVAWTSQALAAPYSAGEAKYQKGDFKGAAAALNAALAKKMAKPDQVRALKLLGICQFMLGQRPAAAQTFKRALAVDPGTTIASSDVLDDTVIPFFNAQKPSPSQGTAKASKPVEKAPTPKVAGTAAKPLKMTYLKILSNVPTAQVSIDGIIAGSANGLINTDPGKVLVELSAPGYMGRKVNVNVVKDRENTITVNLEKPKPKVVAKPKPKPVAPVAVATKKKKKKSANPYTPTPPDDLFIDDAAAPPSGETDPAASGGPDLAAQFEMESGQGGYPTSAPGYAPPSPAYAPPPYYAPPAYAYQPPPAYYAPPQPYYAPPPPPPATTDPYAGTYQDPAAQAPVDPAGAASVGGKKTKGSKPSTLMLLGPFGLGQFVTKRPLLGVLFLGGQAGALFFWKSQTDLADTTVVETNTYLAANCVQTDTAPLSAEQKTVCDDFSAQRKTYVDDARTKAMIGIASFGVLWAGGALEALIYEPKTPKKKKKKRRYSGFGSVPAAIRDADADDSQDEEALAVDDVRRDNLSFDWDMGLMPSVDPAAARKGPALVLDLKWTF